MTFFVENLLTATEDLTNLQKFHNKMKENIALQADNICNNRIHYHLCNKLLKYSSFKTEIDESFSDFTKNTL